ncbi:hypothetical protein PGT21_021109 [Puccinia graminis f. sp. tritici]|uniref:Uncharacterized protein n=1 Tax=Puccinia graminis f. sp. tritici TaxID=56615 RepID=A0A5B0NG70_PUCGR|nr:hypothetical protein PGT21_021109 [Puccinia graminis f. sp. tritici]
MTPAAPIPSIKAQLTEMFRVPGVYTTNPPYPSKFFTFDAWCPFTPKILELLRWQYAYNRTENRKDFFKHGL